MTTQDTGARTDDGAARLRPTMHFTPAEGWMNDPYGIAWADGEYHLYFQAVPGQVQWGPNCHWGHAVSPDLVQWSERPIALTPQDFEVGCWSGSVVHTQSPPTVFYTRVTGENWEIGAVATATRDDATQVWHSEAQDVVVPGPPQGLDVRAFRDPFVFRDEHGWAMLMAAGLSDGIAAVLLYRSEDLEHWTYDGVLCSRASGETDPTWTGSLWECPQLVRFDGRWVLIVSVWDSGELHFVAASTGDYDGHTFDPDGWRRLTYGNSAYAMSAFLDKDGQQCAISWLREEPRNNPQLTVRAGAQSLPCVLRSSPDGFPVLWPHPEVTAQRGPRMRGAAEHGVVNFQVGPLALDLCVSSAAEPLEVTLGEHGDHRLRLNIGPSRGVSITRPGFTTEVLEVDETAGAVRAVFDSDIVEIFTGHAYGAYRIRPATDPARTTVQLTGSAAQEAQLYSLLRH